MIGSLEAWLLLRSLRTLHLRVPRQSQTATALVTWLNLASGGGAHDGIPAGLIEIVYHSSLQKSDAQGFTPDKQMEGGYNATFAIIVSRVQAITSGFPMSGILNPSGRWTRSSMRVHCPIPSNTLWYATSTLYGSSTDTAINPPHRFSRRLAWGASNR